MTNDEHDVRVSWTKREKDSWQFALKNEHQRTRKVANDEKLKSIHSPHSSDTDERQKSLLGNNVGFSVDAFAQSYFMWQSFCL